MNYIRTLRPGLCASSPRASLLTPVRYLRTPPAVAASAAGLNEVDRTRLRKIESMPFQTYQMALQYIRADRAEKLTAIKEEKKRIAEVIKKGGTNSRTLDSMNRHLEYLMIQADINNPRVKYNFDRGLVDMNKPIYRYLLNRKWREYRRPMLMQRLEQMAIFPDILPVIDPVVDVPVRFRGHDLQPGTIVPSAVSERAPTLKIIPFTKGEMLCTVLVVDPDVPDVENDRFTYRLHWLVSNIPVSHVHHQAIGTGAKPSDTIVSWLPPHALKGEPYHRQGLLVFKQSERINPASLRNIKRDKFNTRSFMAKQKLEVIGAYMWRTQWDDTMKDLMQRHNLPGWDKMYIRVKD